MEPATQEIERDTSLTATYSPEDNKLRLYSYRRLDPETYAAIKAQGFRWAPKQDLFVAPAWTPGRVDILLKLCGEIDDEATPLADRQEARAERFEGYQENRAQDAENAHAAVSAIADNIPLGQPILVGHHSEKHARRDAEKIENGMRKAVKMWETSEYWKDRAAGALRHSRYKERADVRGRRIKKLQAEARKRQREIDKATDIIGCWQAVNDKEKAVFVSNYHCHISRQFPLDKYPREAPASQYEGYTSLWSAIRDDVITWQQAKDLALKAYPSGIRYNQRWLDHTQLRIDYETALLGEQGALDLIAKKPRPKQLPLLNYRAPEGIDLEDRWTRGALLHLAQIEMTRAEYAKQYEGNRYTMTSGQGSHRVRILSKIGGGSLSRSVVFLTDSKEHPRPEGGADE